MSSFGGQMYSEIKGSLIDLMDNEKKKLNEIKKEAELSIY